MWGGKRKEIDNIEKKEGMKTCLRKFLKRREGPQDLNQVKELNNKPFGASGTCVKPGPALPS